MHIVYNTNRPRARDSPITDLNRNTNIYVQVHVPRGTYYLILLIIRVASNLLKIKAVNKM